MQSPQGNSPLLAAPGAVPADGPDAGVAAHYGDPFAEQRALSSALGLVDRSHRGVIRITGADRLSWLHSLSTQALEKLEPGGTAETLILSTNGHVELPLTLTDKGRARGAHVGPHTAAPLLDFLESMRFMLRVEPADVTDEFAVLAVLGPAVGPGWADEAPVAATYAFGADLIISRDRLEQAAGGVQERGAVLAGIWAYEALRIAPPR